MPVGGDWRIGEALHGFKMCPHRPRLNNYFCTDQGGPVLLDGNGLTPDSTEYLRDLNGPTTPSKTSRKCLARRPRSFLLFTPSLAAREYSSGGFSPNEISFAFNTAISSVLSVALYSHSVMRRVNAFDLVSDTACPAPD